MRSTGTAAGHQFRCHHPLVFSLLLILIKPIIIPWSFSPPSSSLYSLFLNPPPGNQSFVLLFFPHIYSGKNRTKNDMTGDGRVLGLSLDFPFFLLVFFPSFFLCFLAFGWQDHRKAFLTIVMTDDHYLYVYTKDPRLDTENTAYNQSSKGVAAATAPFYHTKFISLFHLPFSPFFSCSFALAHGVSHAYPSFRFNSSNLWRIPSSFSF